MRKKSNKISLGLKRDVILFTFMVFVVVVVFGVTYAFTNNKSNNLEGVSKNASVEVTSIVSSEVNYIDSGMIGSKVNLYYEVYPSNASLISVSMESSDESVIVINSDNTITPLSRGTSYVTITSLSNNKAKTTIECVVE